MTLRLLAVLVFSHAAGAASAKECWALTNLKGHMAASTDNYAFVGDKFTNPIVLCFGSGNEGSVSGDDTVFVKFGASTLVGWASNKGIELVETYQIDREKNRVLFTKSRIGTTTVIPDGPDVVSAFVGIATRLKE